MRTAALIRFVYRLCTLLNNLAMMFGFFKQKKDHQATINSQTCITVKAGQNLLAAALEAGLDWPHDCRVGSCGTCGCSLKSGKIKALSDFTYVLTAEQLRDGVILACQTALKSDVEVEVALGSGRAGVATAKRQAVLAKTRPLTHDILELTLACREPLPDGIIAGQYAEISYQGLSKPRSYSFAKLPANEKDKELTFYVRHVPGGEFTDWLFAEDRTNARLTVALPFGSFRLHDSDAPMICIAGGSGISAIKAILEHACAGGAARDAYFLFGARAQRDLYCHAEMRDIKAKWSKDHVFDLVEVLSNEPEDSGWSGPRGFVTEYLRTSYIESKRLDVAKCQGYLCGPPPMIDAGIELLVKSGMAEDQIFYDKFLDASSLPGGR